MRSTGVVRSFNLALLPSLLLIASSSAAQPQPASWTAVDQALGRPGTTHQTACDATDFRAPTSTLLWTE